MAKIPGKGTVLQHTISMTLTDIAQLTDIDISGTESLTYDSTTLDGGVFKTYDPTGFSEPGTVTAGLFFDPALAGHQFITDTIGAPLDSMTGLPNDLAMKIIYADTATTEQSFTASGISFGATVVMDDGVKGTATYQIDGDPGWAT